MAASTAVDRTKHPHREAQSEADLALAAIQGVNWPVALLDRDGSVLLQNRCFVESFCADCTAECLSKVFGAFRGRGEKELRHRLTLADGRTFDLDLVDLPAGILVSGRDITAKLAEDAEAYRSARLDGLTGLANRLRLEERLDEVGRDDRRGAAAVLLLNLHRFKRVNDTLGRPVGNALLKIVAERILSALDPSDFAARIGVDEFAVLLPHGPLPQKADMLAARLVDLLGRSYVIEGQLINVGVSVGIAMMPADGSDAETLLRNAGLAVSQAMREVKDSFRFFEGEMNRQMEARQKLETDLRRAIALREFTLAYQPQCNLGDHRITGFETLLRWQNQNRGPVSPGEFIPLAEEIGLIVPIGEWVLRTACREAVRWNIPFRVAVNVSVIQIASPGFPATVMSALSESGLAPERLELEITESVLLGDNAAALETLHHLRELGVRISMDDFGTGYSSLSYLRSFPFDTIKIDQSFVREKCNDGSGMAIVRAAAALGKSLGMTTVAEGVETMEQMRLVAEAGCTDFQGYLISRPLPASEIDAICATHEDRAREWMTARAPSTE
ncbi:bifunctional diguanylate cyclase/phosphodiesterase [Afifella sp. IM 167]|uniref:putative bifunctional diguanylate cyclase/phosphodiesterase n=1 Tax=Afifella sp. IM 167 TaxID=2033586 RepID=UPI001CCFDFB5|nr:bifunctional diguanylate cyclase/phosphodiesterase [Afifella sp. IM 167]MBZ8131689.1 diguanylate cyclase [Afifella sp. IM 167]